MITLNAEKRSMNVKAKRLRREGYVIGNVFGQQIEGSIPVKIEKSAAENLLRKEGRGGQILLAVDGTIYDVLIKEIDYDPVKQEIMTVDFQALQKDRKVHSVAKIVFENHDAVKEGVLEELETEIPYEAYPSALVEKVYVDVSGLRLGDHICLKDLDIAKNPDIDLQMPGDTILVEVGMLKTEAAEETAAADTETK